MAKSAPLLPSKAPHGLRGPALQRTLAFSLVALLISVSGCRKQTNKVVTQADAATVARAQNSPANTTGTEERAALDVDDGPDEHEHDYELKGYWIKHIDATLAQLTDAERARLGQLEREMKAGVIFDNEGNLTSKSSLMGAEETRGGTYSILTVEEDGFTVELAYDADDGEDAEVSEMTVSFLTPDRFRMAPTAPPGQTETDVRRQTTIFVRTTGDAFHRQLMTVKPTP